jgi:hypothetical protein
MAITAYSGTPTEADIPIVRELTIAIEPLLKGRGPFVQSAVLADLVAMWLAGHIGQTPEQTAEIRDTMLALFVEAVRDMIPLNEQMILERLHTEGNA